MLEAKDLVEDNQDQVIEPMKQDWLDCILNSKLLSAFEVVFIIYYIFP